VSRLDLDFSLDDVYTRDQGRLYMSGIQALVRLPLMQARSDRHRGLKTAGLISGYRGSPLGTYDQQLWRAERHLTAHGVRFQPGLNEDLAATALWGAQMHRAYGPVLTDGVFGLWYGKGPGVDRSGDVFRNANILGTAALGGVIALAGDDHAAQSSMFPHQTDGIFQSVMMPVLQPASVKDILTLGLAGYALSRFSGLWVGMKAIAEVIESANAFDAPEPFPEFASPVDFLVPPHGLNWDPAITWPTQRAELERRLVEERLPAALAWARANGIDRLVLDSSRRRRVIVAVGKAHQDVMEALTALQISPARAADMGLVVYKVAMSWPLETSVLKRLALEAESFLVVEEKRPYVEEQLKAALYGLPGGAQPVIWGKTGPGGKSLLPETMEFDPARVARAIVEFLGADGAAFEQVLGGIEAANRAQPAAGLTTRKPFFCAGCPHNRSTHTPEGSISGGGIGCHVMALSIPDRKTDLFCQMGGEGAQWIGAEHYVRRPHLFQNLGDGTYTHSGLLAIRAAVAAKSNITFKILYNDAVAMTGGQAAEGAFSPERILHQLAAEGVGRIALVSEDPSRYSASQLPPGTRLEDREALNDVQRQFRDVPGVSAIVYEQTCASEKRRRRKRGAFPDPARRLFINPRVCEGCGDCQRQSSCIAVEQIETPWGTKRQINQNTCNKDLTCLTGFCPSFAEMAVKESWKPEARNISRKMERLAAKLAPPELEPVRQTFNIFVAGVGGSGVLTLGALIGTAGHIQGLSATTLDFTGLAQKNGAVTSQIRLAPLGQSIHAVRIGGQSLDLLLAADRVVATSADALLRMAAARTRAAVNSDTPPTADALADRDAVLPLDAMDRALEKGTAARAQTPATRLAEGLFGDTATANTLLLGFAWQQGWLPLQEAAIMRAIEINGVAVAANKQAFTWGRLAAAFPDETAAAAGLTARDTGPEPLEMLVRRLAADLTLYQDQAYADRFGALAVLILAAEERAAGDGRFARTALRELYRLMAYKDEYEVARLYSGADFADALAGPFPGQQPAALWLAPPFLNRPDPLTGRPVKRRFGRWIFPALALLAKGKVLRGTRLDPFGWSAERRAERALASQYQADVTALCAALSPGAYDAAAAAAGWPRDIRGFGPVKEAAMTTAWENRKGLMAYALAPQADALSQDHAAE